MFIEKTVCRHIKKALLIQKGFENSCLSGSLKGFGPLVLSLSKFLVQVKKRCHILAYPLQLCHLICVRSMMRCSICLALRASLAIWKRE